MTVMIACVMKLKIFLQMMMNGYQRQHMRYDVLLYDVFNAIFGVLVRLKGNHVEYAGRLLQTHVFYKKYVGWKWGTHI